MHPTFYLRNDDSFPAPPSDVLLISGRLSHQHKADGLFNALMWESSVVRHPGNSLKHLLQSSMREF